MKSTRPEAAPSRQKMNFNPDDHNIVRGKWYLAKELPNPIENRGMDGLVVDLIAKRYNPNKDRFDFFGMPHSKIVLFSECFELKWSWGKDVDHINTKVLAWRLPPDYEEVYKNIIKAQE